MAVVTSRRPWRDGRVDVLVAALSDLGMSVSRTAAGELIDERATSVAKQMRVTEATARNYLSDEAVQGSNINDKPAVLPGSGHSSMSP